MDKEFINNPVAAYEKLKAENERLKEKIKMYKSEDTRKHNVIMETLQHEKKALDVSIKYKETLQEIKDFVNSSRNKLIYLITKAEQE